LTAALHETPGQLMTATSAASSADPTDQTDEPLEMMITDPSATTGPESVDFDGELSSALAGLPGGTQFGSIVHEILEQTDPGSPALQMSLLARCAVASMTGGLTIDPQALARGLEQVLTTPLGGLTDGLSLAELGKANQLAEFDFEMPMGGAELATLAELARLIDAPQYRDPNDVLVGYGEQLASSPAGATVLNGFLTGSIDVVLRANVAGQQKFIVLDYKTNRIPLVDQELRPSHYNQAAMEQIMRDSHYPLQAVLYSVALHRYLNSRLPNYEPASHLGGIGYLFVRGMAGPSTPMDGIAPFGVFTWQPDPQLVVRASEIIAGGR